MNCPSCGATLRTEAQFCGGCGSKVPTNVSVGVAVSGVMAEDRTPFTKKRKRLIIQLALGVGAAVAVVGGVLIYQEMRDDYGADMNFDGYITPREVSDYSSSYTNGWEMSGNWQFRPLTMYGSSDMRQVADRLNTTIEADFLFLSRIYNSLQIGDQDILPLRMEQCRVHRYNVSQSNSATGIHNGIVGPSNHLDVELDCSSQVTRGEILYIRLTITHNDACLKGTISYGDQIINNSNSSYIGGEFIGYKDSSCLENATFTNANVYYPQSVWMRLELTRGMSARHSNFFIINQHLNADTEDRRRGSEAADRQAEAAKNSVLEASCAAGAATDEECAVLEQARRASRDAHAAAEAATEAASMSTSESTSDAAFPEWLIGSWGTRDDCGGRMDYTIEISRESLNLYESRGRLISNVGTHRYRIALEGEGSTWQTTYSIMPSADGRSIFVKDEGNAQDTGVWYFDVQLPCNQLRR